MIINDNEESRQMATTTSKEKCIHVGHRERMRAEFREAGLNGFSAIAKLEYLLFFCIPRGDVNPLAHRLLDRFKTFTGVLDAPVEQLLEIKGLGQNSVYFFKMLPQLFQIYMKEKFTSEVTILDSSQLLAEYLKPEFITRSNEVAMLLCLDSKMMPLACKFISEGCSNFVDINVRKVLEVALAYNSVGVVLAHNHPNGIAIPSRDDIFATKRINDALIMADIHLVDHFIFFGEDYVSMRDSGFLS